MSQIFLRDSGGERKFPGISAYSRSDPNRHLMSPVVGTKPVVLAKLVNPYLLPRALGFDPQVFHLTGSALTLTYAGRRTSAYLGPLVCMYACMHMCVCMYHIVCMPCMYACEYLILSIYVSMYVHVPGTVAQNPQIRSPITHNP